MRSGLRQIRDFLQQSKIALTIERALPDTREFAVDFRTKVMRGHGRIQVPLTDEVAARIAGIFTEESVRVIYRMALKEQEGQTVLHECIDPNFGAARKNAVAAHDQGFLGNTKLA